MRRTLALSLAICLLVLCLAPAALAARKSQALCAAPSGNIVKEDIAPKLVTLEYLSLTRSGKISADDLLSAVQAFQEQELLASSEELESLDLRTVVRLYQRADDSDGDVYAPVYGGQKYHKNASCSGMDDPECVSLSVALELGYTACKRCKP